MRVASRNCLSMLVKGVIGEKSHPKLSRGIGVGTRRIGIGISKGQQT